MSCAARDAGDGGATDEAAAIGSIADGLGREQSVPPNNRIYVVGDKFAEFAKQPYVIQHRVLEHELLRPLSESGPLISLGQGLSPAQVSSLIERAEAVGSRRFLDFQPIEKCGRQLCHKHDIRNALTSVPRPVAPGVFRANLLIDEQGEFMADHQSSRHISGIILIEAARQMTLAVIELSRISSGAKPQAFLWNALTVAFSRLVLPIPTVLSYTTLATSEQRGARLSFTAQIEVWQVSGLCCTVTNTAMLLDQRVNDRREAQLVAAARPVS